MDTEPSSQPYDLLIQGGHVLDPASGVDGVFDVGVRSGKVAQIAPNLTAPGAPAAVKVVDAAGLYVTPGLVDIHTHVYPFRPGPHSYVESVHPDAHLLASGVTTTVDVGTAGWENFIDFKESTIDRAKVRILALINIARRGMLDGESEQDPHDFHPAVAASLARAYPEIVVGIKSAHYWTNNPWDDLHTPWASVDQAREAAELAGGLLMVDFWPRPPERSYPDLILEHLRPGDIHTHVFAQQFPVLAEDGHVNAFYFQARERGVIFDLGHGAGSFWFRQAVPAFRGGFSPDTISTDLHMANINGPVASMQNCMSKFLNMGMPLSEVIWRSTARPAQVIGRPSLGTLEIGAEADLAVFSLLEGRYAFADCGRARMRGTHRLECRLTLRAGKVVYDPYGMSMPDWEQAPADYWKLGGHA